MALIYVTGVAGTGKSTVLKGLQARGIEAYGIEEDEIADWVNTATGLAKKLPPAGEEFDIHKWFVDHDLVINPDKIEALKQNADELKKDVFLCGVADGEDKVWPLFGKVLVLSVDNGTLVERVKNRTGNDFGKTPEELQKIMDWQAASTENYKKLGAIFIDAGKYLDLVLDEVLAAAL